MIKSTWFRTLFFLFVILLSFWFLLNFRITQTPPGINGDEAAIGYNAALVARTGHDQNGRFLPLFVSVFDLTDWKQPITFYATTLAFKVFGPSFSLLRQVSVVFVLVSGVLIFLFSKDILGIKAAFISLLIFLTIPAVLIQSHLALENIAPVPFVILWLWMLAKYQKDLQSKYLFLSATFLGISLFTYPGMRLIFPVYITLTIMFIYYLNSKKKIKEILLEILRFLLVVIIFPIFMYSIKSQYPGAILAYNRPRGVQSYQELVLPYISSFDPSFLFIQGDATPYHSTGRQGVFLLATLPIFAFGIFSIAQKKEPMRFFILIIFFLTPLLYGLAASVHRGSRLLALLPPYTIITTLGFIFLLNIKNNKIKVLIISIAILMIGLNYIDFARDYWYGYPNRVKANFSKPYQLVFERANNLSRSDNLTPFIQSDFRLQDPMAENFFEQAYFYNGLRLWKEDQPLPENSVIIVSDYILSKRRDVVQEVLGDGYFGILVNKK